MEHIDARAAKIIYRLSDVSNQEAITIAGWESINSMYKRKLLTFMYQVYKSELPDNIIRLFSSSNCCYDLRNSIKFEVPRFNLEVGRNSLRYRGALFWNSIPDNLKRAPSLNIFKKQTLVRQYKFQQDKMFMVKNGKITRFNQHCS